MKSRLGVERKTRRDVLGAGWFLLGVALAALLVIAFR